HRAHPPDHRHRPRGRGRRPLDLAVLTRQRAGAPRPPLADSAAGRDRPGTGGTTSRVDPRRDRPDRNRLTHQQRGVHRIRSAVDPTSSLPEETTMFDAIPWYQVRCDALGCTRILTTEDDQPLLIRSPNVDRIPAGAATDDDGTPWTIHYL